MKIRGFSIHSLFLKILGYFLFHWGKMLIIPNRQKKQGKNKNRIRIRFVSILLRCSLVNYVHLLAGLLPSVFRSGKWYLFREDSISSLWVAKDHEEEWQKAGNG